MKASLDTYERSILISTCYGHFMSHFNMLVFPAVLLPMAERLNLPMTAILDMSFWMYLLFGITALPWGVAADRWGARPFLGLFYSGSCASALAISVWIDSPSLLLTGFVALGFFSGIYHPTGLGLISKEVRQVSLAMGYNGMFGNLGLALAPLFAGVLNYFQGPSLVYLFLGIMNLIGLGLMLAFPLSGLKQHGPSTVDGENGRLKPFLILLVAMMLAGIVYRGATVILPAYFELKNQRLFYELTAFTGWPLSSNIVATSVASLIYVVGMGGQYMGGRYAEQFDPRWCYFVFHSIAIPAVLCMSITTNIPLVILAMIYFFFLLGTQPSENTLVALFSPKRFHHSAYGTKFVLTFGVGAVAVKMVGAIETQLRIEAVFSCLGMISFLLVGVIALLIRSTSKSA